MSLLCFFPLLLSAFKQFSRIVAIMLKKVTIMPVCHGKKFTVGDGERLVRVLFYTLLRFDSLQFSVDCPTAPASRVAVILCFRAKSEVLGKPAQ